MTETHTPAEGEPVVEAVRALHSPVEQEVYEFQPGIFVPLSAYASVARKGDTPEKVAERTSTRTVCAHCRGDYPCPTVQILTGKQ